MPCPLLLFRPRPSGLPSHSYSSELGEAFRPLTKPLVVRSLYGISWAYVLSDVAYAGYKGREVHRELAAKQSSPDGGSAAHDAPTPAKTKAKSDDRLDLKPAMDAARETIERVKKDPANATQIVQDAIKKDPGNAGHIVKEVFTSQYDRAEKSAVDAAERAFAAVRKDPMHAVQIVKDALKDETERAEKGASEFARTMSKQGMQALNGSGKNDSASPTSSSSAHSHAHTHADPLQHTEGMHVGLIVARRAVFQTLASMALPAFTVHSVVHYSQPLFKAIKNHKVRGIGPTLLGLAVIPALVSVRVCERKRETCRRRVCHGTGTTGMLK